jgi:hypothetical protein
MNEVVPTLGMYLQNFRPYSQMLGSYLYTNPTVTFAFLLFTVRKHLLQIIFIAWSLRKCSADVTEQVCVRNLFIAASAKQKFPRLFYEIRNISCGNIT